MLYGDNEYDCNAWWWHLGERINDNDDDDEDTLVTKRLKLEFLSQRWDSHSEQERWKSSLSDDDDDDEEEEEMEE